MDRVLYLVLLLLVTAPAPPAAAESFQDWLAGFRVTALNQGIKAGTFDRALGDAVPVPRVVELDRAQPEFTLSYSEYMSRVVPERRVREGRRHRKRLDGVFRKLEGEYGVPAGFLVALWGIETDYGRRRGGFAVIPALATLAWDGRRAGFFREELLAVLRLVQEGVAEPAEMVGSWAGAMGQTQFLPSTARRYWVDHNGNGHMDIWTDPVEALASAANYLKRLGWDRDGTWGMAVEIPDGFPPSLFGLNVKKTVAAWRGLGVTAGGSALPDPSVTASLVRVEEGGPYFLVFPNFRRLLAWNRSIFFGVAVGTLADRIAGGMQPETR